MIVPAVNAVNRVPKGFRVPGLQPEKCRAPGEGSKTNVFGLQGSITFSLGLQALDLLWSTNQTNMKDNYLEDQQGDLGARMIKFQYVRLHRKCFRAPGTPLPPWDPELMNWSYIVWVGGFMHEMICVLWA